MRRAADGRRVDSLSSGANWDSSWRCGHGTGLRPAQLGGALRDRPTPGRRLLGAADRSGSGSLAVDDRGGVEAQRGGGRRLRPGRGPVPQPGAAQARPEAGARRRAARAGAGAARPGALAAAGRGPAAPRSGPHGDLPRSDLRVHLRPDQTHQGLPLAAAVAAGAQPPAAPRRAGPAQLGRLHQAAPPARRAPRRGRRAQ